MSALRRPNHDGSTAIDRGFGCFSSEVAPLVGSSSQTDHLRAVADEVFRQGKPTAPSPCTAMPSFEANPIPGETGALFTAMCAPWAVGRPVGPSGPCGPP